MINDVHIELARNHGNMHLFLSLISSLAVYTFSLIFPFSLFINDLFDCSFDCAVCSGGQGCG